MGILAIDMADSLQFPDHENYTGIWHNNRFIFVVWIH